MNETQGDQRNTLAVARLGRFDPCYSVLHGCRVRFGQWADSTWAEVLDNNTCAPLPDLVHKTQLRATW
jgi:hypothetical protein